MPRSLGARIGIGAAVVGVIALGGAGVLLFGLTIDETHFDRPSAEFDALRTEIATVDGVEVVGSERWVEAPTFSDPSSSMSVTVDADALPDLLARACGSTYPDAVSWAIEVDTAAETRVSLFSDAAHGCPAIGFDPTPVVAEIDRVAPGVQVQAAVMDNGMFSLFAMENGFEELVPLVAQAETVRDAAELAPGGAVEVAATRLGVTVGPGEGPAYAALLTRLVDDYGVTYFSAASGGTPIDGIEKVQLAAPERNHAAVEAAIAQSALPLTALPVAFLPE
jgi:hypothetical protein